MHSAIAISALLGAGALAHPSFQHRHNHNKRDTIVTSTVGNDVMVEVIDLVTVTVTAGQLPTSQPPVALAAPQKLAVNPPAAAPLSVTPIASPSQTPKVEASPSSSSTPTVASSPASAPVASSPENPDTSWATSPLSPLGGGSGAKDVLTQANYWRQQWKGLPPFTWSSLLANNSYMTATQPTYKKSQLNKATGMYEDVPHNEGGAKTMGHELYAGSSSQCIAPGDDTTVTQEGLTPFDKAFLMWICELPTPSIQDQCKLISEGYTITSTGHADIIKGTVSQIGCYYMNTVGGSGKTGLWTCDFA